MRKSRESKYDIEVLKNEVFFFDDEKGFRVVDSKMVPKVSRTDREYKVRRLWVTADDENMLEIGTQSFNKKSFRKRLDKITTEWIYKKETVEEQPTRYEIELTSVMWRTVGKRTTEVERAINDMANIDDINELKKYWRTECKKFHPDHGGNAEDFAEVRFWYEEELRNIESIQTALDEILNESVVEPVEPVEVKEIERDEFVRELVQENDFYGIYSAYKGIRDARDLINGLLLECLCDLDNYVTSGGIRREDFIEDTFVYIVKETNDFIDRTFKDVFKENEEEGMNWFATAYVQELRYLLQEKRLLEIIEEKIDEYIEDVKKEFPFIRVIEPDKYSKEFKNLTPKEAKRKMRELSKQLHPDLHPELDGSEFRKMYDAYEKHMSRVA